MIKNVVFEVMHIFRIIVVGKVPTYIGLLIIFFKNAVRLTLFIG